MAIELVHTLTDDTYRYAASNLASGLYRILIPNGARLWGVGIQTYLYDAPARATLAFDDPPEGAFGGSSDTDLRETLSLLWDGATLDFESPERSGVLSISQPESTSTFVADSDRWLYLAFDFPAGRALGWQSRIEMGEPVTPTDPPPPTEQTDPGTDAYDRAVEAGLIDPAGGVGGVKIDQDLLASTAHTSVADPLIRLVSLSSARGKIHRRS